MADPSDINIETPAATIPRPAAISAFLETWGRRLVTVPTYTLGCVGIVLVLPVLLAFAAVLDLARRRNWVLMRTVTFLAAYLCCEVAGMVASFAIWVWRIVFRATSHEQFLTWNFALQCWWGSTLFRAAAWIFALRMEVDERGDLGHGPVIVFIRHASVADTLLPVVFLSSRHGLRLRYVLKRELLWDPCLDIVGNRLPNCFVHRGSDDSAREIAAVRGLLNDLGPRDGVLIYPEGTRFSPGKRERALTRLAARAPGLLERARVLNHVLPPRLGGALALLQRNREADIVFCAHVGLESTASFKELLRGRSIGNTVRVVFWRVPFEQIPRDREGKIEWLFEQWRAVDDWIGGSAPGAASTCTT
jgi:1-acyl-sn-glycerol-3-phosphate acyltransferase